LNEGAAGLDRLREEARALGVEISGETAKAADDFGDNLTRLGTAVSGVGQAIASDALPYLVDFTNALVIAAKEGNGLYGVLTSLGQQLGSALFEKFNGLEATGERIAEVRAQIQYLQNDLAKTKSEDWFFSDLQQARIQNVTKKISELTAELPALTDRYARLQEQTAGATAAEDRHGEMLELNAKRVTLTVVAEDKKTKARKAGAAATDAATKAEQKHADEVERTLDALKLQYVELTQGERARYEMELATKGWTEAEREAALALYDQNEALRKTQAELKNAKDETNVYAEVVEDAARGMRGAFSSFFESLLTDGTKAFKNFGETVKRLFIKLLADLMSAALANPIQILLGISTAGASGAAAASAGSLATGGAASAGGGLLGNLGTSLLGGITGFSSALYGGLGALGAGLLEGGLTGLAAGGATASAGLLGTAGNLLSFGSAGITSGTLSGLAAGLGAVTSVALPVLAVAAAIAGLAGLFKDKNPDEEWFRLVSGTGTGNDATKIGSVTTAFGEVGVSAWEDLAGDGKAFTDKVTKYIETLDAQLAQFLTEEQIKAAKAVLASDVAASPAFGGDADMTADQAVAKVMRDRYTRLIKAIDWEIGSAVEAAALDTQSVAQAVAAAGSKLGGTNNAAALASLAEQINASVARALLGITDPFAAALQDLDAEFTALRQSATAAGADLVQIETLYGLKRTAILKQQAAEQARIVGQAVREALTRQIADLQAAFGDLAGAMRQLEPPAELLVDAWRRTKTEMQSLADGLDALLGIGQQTDLQALQGLLGVVEQFAGLADSLGDQIFSARLSGASPAGQSALYAARERELWAAMETAPDSAKAGIAQQITEAVIGRIRAQGQADLQATQSIYDAQYDSAVTAAELTAEARAAEIDALQEQIRAAEDLADRAERLAEIVASMGQFVDALRIGDLSALNPGDQLGVARTQFRTALAGARRGDEAALENLQDFAQTYLQEGQGYYGGATSPYAAIFSEVTSALDGINVSIAQPPDIALLEQQLAALEAQEQAAFELQRATVDTSAQEVAALETLRLEWLDMASEYQGRADDQIVLIREQIAQMATVIEGQEAQIRQQAAMHAELMTQLEEANANLNAIGAATNLALAAA
jgi:hypothetical protein